MTIMPETCLDRFQRLFNQMSSDQLGALESVYSPDVRFADPFVTVEGLDALTEYFSSAYTNVISCSFRFDDVIGADPAICLPWTMTLQHRRIRRGTPIQVDGISHLQLADDLIIAHRDYFDAGQLLYEHLPVLGSAVRLIRKYAA
ncbi:nuclear transport factor 2 family protein [Marinobacter sp. NFXS9]|uniref:nuclear transport factor 2 family protein n=1 Tax=Marinobacter sp. NFXS9 TaxID=2818433 RepID=UPI0032DFFFA2